MQYRKGIALLLTLTLMIGLLGGCGLGGQSGLIRLNEAVIQRMLQEEGLNLTVAENDALNQAVEQAAQNLEGAQRPGPEPVAVRSQIARQSGMTPLICSVYDWAYWPNSLLGNPNRHEQTAVSFAQQLYQEGYGSAYAAAVAAFSTRDGDKMLLFVMTEGS